MPVWCLKQDFANVSHNNACSFVAGLADLVSCIQIETNSRTVEFRKPQKNIRSPTSSKAHTQENYKGKCDNSRWPAKVSCKTIATSMKQTFHHKCVRLRLGSASVETLGLFHCKLKRPNLHCARHFLKSRKSNLKKQSRREKSCTTILNFVSKRSAQSHKALCMSLGKPKGRVKENDATFLTHPFTRTSPCLPNWKYRKKKKGQNRTDSQGMEVQGKKKRAFHTGSFHCGFDSTGCLTHFVNQPKRGLHSQDCPQGHCVPGLI